MNVIGLLLTLALITGMILLQIFLSRRESKWPGLVLPILCFLFSLIFPLNVMAGPLVETLLLMLLVLLLANIPTFVFLGIYFGCRGKFRRKKQLDKINIQDL